MGEKNRMGSTLEQLKDGLVVSCQPVAGGSLDHPGTTAAFATAVLRGGASGLRIEGIENLKAVRAVTDRPIIGLVKVALMDSPVRITPQTGQVRELVKAGADIVAFDASDRARPEPISSLVEAILDGGAIAMADCATLEDGRLATDLGCEILGSTLSGYLGGPVPSQPDLELVRSLAGLGRFTMAEGRYRRPEDLGAALEHGADGVVVGSAITRPEHVTSWFATELAKHASGEAV